MEKILKEFCDYCQYDKSKIQDFLTFRSSSNKNENQVIIYTDGACSGNGKANSTAGIGVFFDNGECVSQRIEDVINDILPGIYIGNPSNQKAELLAILKALKMSEHFMKQNYSINIKTDSMYCVNVFTKWYKSWENNGWKTSTGRGVLNKEIIEAILKYVKNEDILFSYVPAHREEPVDSEKHKDWYGNKQADSLAVKAIN